MIVYHQISPNATGCQQIMPRQDVRPKVDSIYTEDREVFETPGHLLLVEVPSPPGNFNELAAFWWQYYCQLMIETGTLSKCFIGTISNFCQLSALIEACEEKISEQGTFIEVAKKYKGEEYIEEALNPLTYELRKMYSEFDRLATSLGLTPYSSRIHAIDASGGSLTNPISEPPLTSLGSPPETIKFVKEA